MNSSSIIDIPVTRPYVAGSAVQYVREALESGWLSPRGKLSQRFAEALGQRVRAKAVLTNSGTSALEVAIRSAAKMFRIEKGEIVAPAYTCPDVAVAILKSGFRPVFADVDMERMSITAETLSRVVSEQTVGVIAVHSFGMAVHPSVYPEARKRQLFIIDDCAECFGIEPHGTDLFELSDVAITSLRGDKVLPVGVGGVVMTRHEGLFGIAQGMVGINSPGGYRRLFAYDVPLSYEYPEVLSALGLAQLEAYDEAVARRREVVGWYADLGVASAFVDGDVPWKLPVSLPRRSMGLKKAQQSPAYQAWEMLKIAGIETSPPHAPLYHLRFLGVEQQSKRGAYPNTEHLADHALALPVLPDMSFQEVQRVVEVWHRAVQTVGAR